MGWGKVGHRGFNWIKFELLYIQVEMSSRQLEMSLEYGKEIQAKNINWGVFSIGRVCRAINLNDTT